jgi:hypothetical protein
LGVAVVEIDPSAFRTRVGSMFSQAPAEFRIRVGSTLVVVASVPSGNAWVVESAVVSESIVTGAPVEAACASAA